ncbi:hypothetical protein J437_LFUL019416 [Ladona fulva]|nr:hypothetical protein J437_LFUL019416 [Ladona fulva]
MGPIYVMLVNSEYAAKDEEKTTAPGAEAKEAPKQYHSPRDRASRSQGPSRVKVSDIYDLIAFFSHLKAPKFGHFVLDKAEEEKLTKSAPKTVETPKAQPTAGTKGAPLPVVAATPPSTRSTRLRNPPVNKKGVWVQIKGPKFGPNSD